MRLQHGLLLGAVCLLLLSLGLWVAVRLVPAPTSSVVSSPRTDPLPPPVPVAQAPRETPPPPPAPAPRQSPPAPPIPPPVVRESPPPPVAAQEPPPPPTPPVDSRSDRFEPQNGQEPEIRTLLSVGDIRMGVVRDSHIRDEAGLKQLLVRIGDDLEKRVQAQREQQPQQGERGLQQLLDDYREELGKYMDGEVELRGPGFMIGTEVGPPLPREKWWKPRPQ